MQTRVCFILAVMVCGLAGCNPRAQVPPPVETSLEGTDVLVAERLAELLSAARENPNSARARAELGMAYEMSGRTQAAHDCYAHAAALDPAEPRWLYLAAYTRSEFGDVEGALATLDRMIEIDDTYAGAYLFRGQWLLDLGRVEEAGRAYARATELAPTQAASWIGIAKVHLRAGRPREALQILQRLLQQAPEHPSVNRLAGEAYRELGELEKARAAFAKTKPGETINWVDPWLNERLEFRTGFGAGMIRATELMNRGRNMEAVQIMERLRIQRPDDRQMLNNLSVAYRNLNQPDRAFDVLLDGLRRHPEYHPFHLNISADYQRKGNIEQALWHLNRVIEITPTFVPGWERIGSVHLAQKNLPEALSAFETAARYKPDSQTYVLYCGIILAELRRFEEALDRLESALEIDPNQAAVLLPLGRVQAEIGLYAEARASLDRARSLAPGSRHLDAAYARLSELEGSKR